MSASGARQGYQELARRAQGSSPKEDQDSPEDCPGSDMNPGSSLGIGPRIRRCGGSSPSVRYDFAEGIGEIARNTPGDRWRKTVRLVAGKARGCRYVGIRSLSLVVMF
ncbi:hypothetical protein B296_00040344 [Ensete ventricosum]|uniref:Uncharacterized protein n=1 Tax=Ensete ventricosum TaxID=4639 RepID=A0A426WX81_ENSVE|nr:hypothetical protein B296_00040344 [Ensete ventricosum]